MELNHLRYFFEVAKQGSFTAASKSLRISQPSLSRTVRILEEDQGLRLFERTKKGIRLTDAGRLYYETCNQIFSQLNELKNVMTAHKTAVSGSVRLGASDNLCNYVFPSLFMKFWKNHPGIRIKLFSGTSEAITDQILSSKAEFGLCYSAPKNKSLKSENLAFVEFALICSAKNRLLSDGRFLPGRLEKAYFIGSRLSDYSEPYPALRMLRSIGVCPKLQFETNNQETQKQMALQELGYTLVPRHMVRKELADGELCEIKTPRLLGAQIHLLYKTEASITPAAMRLIEHLRSELPEALSR